MPSYREAIEAATGMKMWALTDDERLLRPFRAYGQSFARKAFTKEVLRVWKVADD